MSTAVFQYKCRRCGQIFDGPHTAEKNAVPFLVEIESGKLPPGIPTGMTDIHNCPGTPRTMGKGLGVTDLIGVEFRKEFS